MGSAAPGHGEATAAADLEAVEVEPDVCQGKRRRRAGNGHAVPPRAVVEVDVLAGRAPRRESWQSVPGLWHGSAADRSARICEGGHFKMAGNGKPWRF